MHLPLKACAAALALLAGAAVPAAAQSDILLQLRSGSPASDRFRVDSAGGVVALGEIGYGIIPASGAGWRMMWHPQKVAFRAGYVDVAGQWNESNIGYYSWAGGALTTAAAIYSFAMGNNNTVEQSAQGGVALGGSNRVWGTNSDLAYYGVALGLSNDVKDQYGLAAGFDNTTDGDAAVALGYKSTADADYSMAFGYRASTNGHTGAKVFADASIADSIEAVANNEFAVRAAGGYRFRSNATLTTGCNLPAGSGVFTCSSSRLLKDRFEPVDGDDVLSRIRRVPVNTWSYTSEGNGVRHMGPFAEDFRAAFGLGVDDTSIGHLDISGVTFAGVQALDARTQEMQSTITRQGEQIQSLQAQNQALEARIQRLEALLSARTPAP